MDNRPDRGQPDPVGRTPPGRGTGSGEGGPGLPLVGLSTYYSTVAWGSWRRPAAAVPAAYFELVAAAGGRPVLLPPCRRSPGGPGAGAAEAIHRLDALVLIGGGDVDPALYRELPDPATGGVDPMRDRSELDLLAAALDRDLPTLAICRGMQLLNVYLGGTLLQHLPAHLGNTGHQPSPGQFAEIEVETVAGTRTAKAIGPSDRVLCSHHQAVGRIGDGLEIAASSVERSPAAPAGSGVTGPSRPGVTVLARPGVVEAVEMPGRRWVVGVQWHPEESGDRRLFEGLIGAVG